MGMFAFSTKRQREPDGPADLEDNAIREKKRHRPLTLRISPDTVAPHCRPSTLTPVESSDDDDGDDHKHKPSNAIHVTTLRGPSSGSSSDTTMDIDAGRELPLNGDDLSPWISARNNNGSVHPSPIPRSLIDQSLNLEGNPVAQAPSPVNLDSTIAMDHDSILPAEDSDWRRANAAKAQETVWWCPPRLPSPISEDEDVPGGDSKDSASDVEMSYTLSRPASPRSHEPRDPNMQASFVNRNIVPEGAGPSFPVENTISSKKVTFFMGYRADCDKCRCKVPGHYSHIIRA